VLQFCFGRSLEDVVDVKKYLVVGSFGGKLTKSARQTLLKTQA